MKKIVLFTVIGILLAGGFYLNRQSAIDQLRSELSSLQAEKLALQQTAVDIAALETQYATATTADVSAFTEALYGCARQVGIHEHEITTRNLPAEVRTRGRRSKMNMGDLKTNRLQVELSGSFRQIAEYINRVQKLTDHKKINAIALLPGEDKLAATVTIDLYSLEAPNAR
jgi:hypothetical protein